MSLELKEYAHYWPWAAGAVVGFILIKKVMGGSGAAASTGASDASVLAGASANAAAANAASTSAGYTYQLNQTALSDKMQFDTATLAAQGLATGQAAQVANVSAIGGVIGQIGTLISGTLASQSVIPVAAINAAARGNQIALAASASVASAGIQALPGTLAASAQLVQAQYAPLQSYGSTVVGLSQSIASTSASAMNGLTNAATSADKSAASASASAQAANASTMQTITSVAEIAAMVALA